MVKQSITINGRILSWDVPDKVIKKKKKRRQKRKEPNNFRTVIKTNFVKYLEEYHTKDFTTFLEEFPFSLKDNSLAEDDIKLISNTYFANEKLDNFFNN